MGAEQSGQVRAALDGAEAEGSEGRADATQLWKLDKAREGFRWLLVASPAPHAFYDANEDYEERERAWHLEVDAGDIDERVDATLRLNAERSSLYVTFIAREVWRLSFPTEGEFRAFCAAYQRKLFENTYGVEDSRKNREAVLGADYAGRMYGEGEAEEMDWDEEEDGASVASDASLEKQRDGQRAIEKAGSPISLMKMGIGANSFYMAGPSVSVLRNMEGRVQDKAVSFSLESPSGENITPVKAILAQGEKKMNILGKERTSTVYNADIETGKVVAEWEFQKDGVDVPMKEITTEAKGAQADDRSTFLGLDTNRLCRWDLRDPHGVVQEMTKDAIVEYVGGKDYASGTGTKFTCMATSGDGSVAVGSADGKIRLYSNNLKLTRAATQLPPLGPGITELDVSCDGKWVIGTTDQFLVLLKTTSKDPKTGQMVDGFKKSIAPISARPKLLALKPEDAVLLGRKPLRHGRFTFVTESGHQERWIVASCGNYSILWNFRQAKTSKGDSTSHGGLQTITKYHLVSQAEDVVDSQFMHENYAADRLGQQSSLVVATKNKLLS
ncbi:unnamed protein product [Ostreobium quekettii]|uniref:Vacuolar import/degradation Vid27 C-terminal domain-containing protein n=1 Tax=Ostreobium quekettii TaxID=121088 RepID=A0A8S1J460_9CHLO|nr:unnamed protein product [Ostreobium quekettii]